MILSGVASRVRVADAVATDAAPGGAAAVYGVSLATAGAANVGASRAAVVKGAVAAPSPAPGCGPEPPRHQVGPVRPYVDLAAGKAWQDCVDRQSAIAQADAFAAIDRAPGCGPEPAFDLASSGEKFYREPAIGAHWRACRGALPTTTTAAKGGGGGASSSSSSAASSSSMGGGADSPPPDVAKAGPVHGAADGASSSGVVVAVVAGGLAIAVALYFGLRR